MKTTTIVLYKNENQNNMYGNVQHMTSLEIAELTGKPHNDVMKAIRKMEPAWLKVNGGNFSLVEYRDKKGQLRPCYSLTKTECLYIATKFNDEARCAKGLCHGDRWLTYLHPCSARLVLLCFKAYHARHARHLVF